MRRAKLRGNLPAAGSHGLLVKLPVIFEMHIGTVSCRVKSGPLRQGRFGNGNGAYIRFLFSHIRQDAGHGIVAMKVLGIQPDRLTNFSIRAVSGEKIFADSDFLRLCREFSFYQLHLAAGNIHHVAVAVHIGGVVSLLRMLLPQQIVFAHPGKLRQVFQHRHIGRLYAGEDRLIGVGHLITLDLCNRNR